MVEQRIYLQPFGGIEPEVMYRIGRAVEDAFDVPVDEMKAIDVPESALSGARGQYHSTALLRILLQRVPEDALRVLGITEVDLFVPQLNFVFGEATVDGRVGVISLCRLRPEFYGSPTDTERFIERAVTEAVHELGHTFGLGHCRHRNCVMYFSTNIEDTDRKSARFCAHDARRLAGRLRPLRAAA